MGAFIQRQLKLRRLTRPEICQQCGGFTCLEAHHADYRKPSEVLWLCKRCHEQLHHFQPQPDYKAQLLSLAQAIGLRGCNRLPRGTIYHYLCQLTEEVRS